MNKLIDALARIGDKSGTVGAIVSTMGCASCFPALASLGAALGLGFLSRWEGLFVNTLLPAFAWLALAANALGWFGHRQWRRTLAGLLGPAIVLLSLYPWFPYAWSTWTLYAGLALMLVVALWDLLAPAHRRCAPKRSGVRPGPEATLGIDAAPQEQRR